MEISYKRDLRHSYLIIRKNQNISEDYRIKMILNNTIKGLLKF
ncbi:MAG: DUF6382 domain-containing protein, partial [Eubacterium sp.]